MPKSEAKADRPQFEVLGGLNYPPNGDREQPEVRREPGDVVDDLPEQSVGWLLEDGLIRRFPPDPEPVADEAAPEGAEEGL